MEQIIERLFTDPFFLKVGLVIVVLITLSIFKKLFKGVLILVLVLVSYGLYVYSTGAEPVKLEDVKEKIEELKELDEKKLRKSADKTLKKATEKIEELIEFDEKKFKKATDNTLKEVKKTVKNKLN